MWIRLGGRDHREKEDVEMQVTALDRTLALSSYVHLIAQERKTHQLLRKEQSFTYNLCLKECFQWFLYRWGLLPRLITKYKHLIK